MIVEAPPDVLDQSIRNWVEKRSRCFADRRSGVDRRIFYSIDYFVSGGQERRSGGDRRSGIERRRSWVRNGVPCTNQST